MSLCGTGNSSFFLISDACSKASLICSRLSNQSWSHSQCSCPLRAESESLNSQATISSGPKLTLRDLVEKGSLQCGQALRESDVCGSMIEKRRRHLMQRTCSA